MDIHEFLSGYRDDEIIYLPDPGNAGDNVIASATYSLFEKNHIRFRYYNDRMDLKGRILFYGGGGNLTRFYNNAQKLLERHHQEVKEFVLLPHTVDGHKELLRQLGKNVTIICREHKSFEFVSRTAPECNILQMDDLAFSLDMKSFIEEKIKLPRNLRDFVNSVRFFPGFVAKRRTLLDLEAGLVGDVLYAFRTDVEANGSDLPSHNIDISEVLHHRVYPQFICDLITREFVKIINQYRKIETDRLHVAIVAALLGLDVKFYPGSYHKNLSVYQASLQGKYPNIVFVPNPAD